MLTHWDDLPLSAWNLREKSYGTLTPNDEDSHMKFYAKNDLCVPYSLPTLLPESRCRCKVAVGSWKEGVNSGLGTSLFFLGEWCQETLRMFVVAGRWCFLSLGGGGSCMYRGVGV